MTREEFEYLKTHEARELIERYIETDPVKVALKVRNAAVATQIRNLQKCRAKLPSYYEARCLIPTVSYEQSSSEAAAFSRHEKGSNALDLTCGLGVDSLALSRSFDRVTAVEIDSLRAEIARYNFKLLGADNITVLCTAAEDFITSECVQSAMEYDLIYVDPSRRSADGRSIYAVEQCSPNILEMTESFRRIAHRAIIKLSPLFDVTESFRLFGDESECHVVTVNNECKEVVVVIGSGVLYPSKLMVVASRGGVVIKREFNKEQIADAFSVADLDPHYISIPDIGFYKSRTVAAMMGEQSFYYKGGYVVTEAEPEKFCGSVFKIKEVLPYQPKVLKKRFKKAVIHLRDFPYNLQQIGITQGGTQHLLLMRFQGVPTVFVVE